VCAALVAVAMLSGCSTAADPSPTSGGPSQPTASASGASPSTSSPSASASPSPSTSPSTPANPDSPSGVAIPKGEPAGWTRVYGRDSWTGRNLARDFTAYPSRWRDTSTHGRYSGLANVSTKPGLLLVRLASDATGPRVTAIMPNLGEGQRNGRYSVRARMSAVGTGYKTSWVLWPDDERWPLRGSMAWPDGAITGAPTAISHWASPTGGQDTFSQPALNSDWHTYTTEWVPGRVRFYLDGTLVGSSTNKIPSTSMHWVLQSETVLGATPPRRGASATIEIDWITMATRA
jgi:hypothetical protein